MFEILIRLLSPNLFFDFTLLFFHWSVYFQCVLVLRKKPVFLAQVLRWPFHPANFFSVHNFVSSAGRIRNYGLER